MSRLAIQPTRDQKSAADWMSYLYHRSLPCARPDLKVGQIVDWGTVKTHVPNPGSRIQVVLPIDDEQVSVGTLSHDDGRFVFEYTDAFKDRQLPTIVGFPCPEHRYDSAILWQFFQGRIPPDVDQADIFEMLLTFGRRRLTSSYRLIGAEE